MRWYNIFMSYEFLKKELIKNIYQFDLTDNLFNLANAILISKSILSKEECDELLKINKKLRIK